MPRLRGAQALVQALEAHGVRYVFGLPGHGNMNILDAIYDSTQVQFKLVRHEQAAAHIADGYARISGEVGVCCSSVGPGAANMIMGLATAQFTSSPVLAISGGIIAKWAGRGQLQETSRSETLTDQCYTQALQPFTKKVWDIQQPELAKNYPVEAGLLGEAKGTLRELIVDREAVYPPVAGVWYEPARSPDARMPRGSGRQWTV